MKAIIIMFIMLILGTVSAVGFSENKIIIKDNGEVKQISQNERLQKVQHMKELKELHKPLKELKREEMKSKIKGIKNKNLVKSSDIINIDLDKSNNKTVVRKHSKAYNVYGGVERENLNNATIQIQERLIAITDYDNSNEEFKVTLYTGDDNQVYNIYRHQDITKNTDEIRRDGEYLKSVISYNGYITYYTNEFSIQSAQLIQDISLIGTEQYIIELSDYFINYDSVRLNIYENNIFIQELACGSYYGTGSAIYTEQNIEYSIDCSTPTDIIIYLDSSNVQQTLFNSLRVFQAFLPLLGATENFYVSAYTEGSSPEQNNLISNMLINGNQQQSISMGAYFSNFEVIEVTTPTGTLKINGGGTSQYRTYTSNDLDIWLDYLASSDTYLLSIFGKNKDYSYEMNVTAKNLLETLTVSDNFIITTNKISEVTPVTLTYPIGVISVTGTNSVSLNLNTNFLAHSTIRVNYYDSVLDENIQLEKSKGDGFSVTSTGDITATLTSYPNTVVLTLTGTNIDLANKEITVKASNEVNFIEDTFLFSTTEQVISTPSGLEDGLQAYWTLDNVLTDATGNENTLTNNGATYIADGKINGSYSFDGSDDYMTSSLPSDWFNTFDTSDKSWQFWIKTSSTMNYMSVSTSRYSDNNPQFELLAILNGELRTVIRDDSGNGPLIKTSGVNINDNNWHQVVMTWDYSTDTVSIYVDGSFVVSETSSFGTVSQMTSSEPFTLGARNSGGSLEEFYDGIIDEVGIWNRALSQEEITELYNNNSGNQFPFTVLDETAEPQKIGSIAPISITGTEVIFISLSDYYTNYNKVVAYNSLVLGAESVSLSLDSIDDSDCAFGRFTSENVAKYEYCLEKIDNDIILKVSGINLDSSDLDLYLIACDDCNIFSYPEELESIISINTIQGVSDSPYFLFTNVPLLVDGNDLSTLFIDNIAENFDSVTIQYLSGTTSSFISGAKGEFLSEQTYNSENIRLKIICETTCRLEIEGKNSAHTGVISIILSKAGNTAIQSYSLTTTFNSDVPIPEKTFWDYLPSWFPQEEQAQKTTLAISIIVLACGFVFITPQEQTFKYPLILFVLVSLFILFAYLGWIPAWIIIIMIILTILLGYMFFRGGSNNG